MTPHTPHALSRRRALGLIGTAALTAPAAVAAMPTPALALSRPRAATEVLIDKSFDSYEAFESAWNYLYPWGEAHNGSARMVGSPSDHSHIAVSGGELTLTATPVSEGDIHYLSGAVHAKQQVLIDDEWPRWEVRGEFQAPSATGTWPAFWLTGVDSWPPESDVLEFKGTRENWFNTYKNADGDWSSSLVPVDSPDTWHEYRAVLTRLNATNVRIEYHLDGALQATHEGGNFVGTPFWIIVNLQMEGSSGGPGPTTDTVYRARDLYVARSTA